MIYVMECGPVFHSKRAQWVVLSLDSSTRRVMTRVAPTREEARQSMRADLGGAPAACCPSLAGLGWEVQPPPDEVLALTAVTLVGLEHQDVLGPLAFSRQTEALLRAGAMFLDTAPWRQFNAYEPLHVTFGGEVTRVVAVGGSGTLPPSLIMLPDQPAFERAQRDARAKGGFDDAVIIGLDDPPDLVSDTIELAFGEAFHPRLLRLHRGKPTSFSADDLLRLTAALAAVTSLAAGRAVGRAVVGELEAIVVPCRAQPSQRN
ncbi:MAG: hypothetical protein Q8L48_22345 [Archangium sp.]|nr:hypothetical protein [Archangium sp.]